MRIPSEIVCEDPLRVSEALTPNGQQEGDSQSKTNLPNTADTTATPPHCSRYSLSWSETVKKRLRDGSTASANLQGEEIGI